MSETFCLGALLAVIGGFLDAYTYLTRGRVFANAQTGNLVLLAMNLAGGQFQKAQYYLIPILAFIAGVLIAEVTCRCFQKAAGSTGDKSSFCWKSLHWLRLLFFLPEIGIWQPMFWLHWFVLSRCKASEKSMAIILLPPCVPEICVVVLNC